METLAHKLRALQAKLRRALESATEETSLAALVALNESVSQVLARAEIYFVVENTDTDECMCVCSIVCVSAPLQSSPSKF
jgi:hypothetical protein